MSTTSTDLIGDDSQTPGRSRAVLHRLTERAIALRRRSRPRTSEWDRALLIGGGVALPLGVLLVALGWFGASRTVLLFEQIPYLLSGGLLGLALVVAGGFVYWSYWQTLMVRELRAQRTESAAAFARLESLFARSLTGGKLVAGSAPTPANSTFVATPNGSMLHRTDCTVVVDRDDLRRVGATTPGLLPCRICEPISD